MMSYSNLIKYSFFSTLSLFLISCSGPEKLDLSNIESEKVILKLSEPNRAGLLIPEDINDNEDITMLVMPVMLNDNA